MRFAMLALILGLSVSGCATTRSATSFDGSGAAPRVGPASVGRAEAVPPGYDLLGTVRASCTLVETTGELDGELVSDVDCSVRRLSRALEERAAFEGGDLLVGLTCRSRPVRTSGPIRRTPIRCRADVARSKEERARAVPPDLDEAAMAPASEAWNIRAWFTPQPAAPQRPPKRSDFVTDVATIPLSHVELGSVVTSCERGCSLASAREAVREVAGRVGANTVVDVGCAARDEGWACTGTAAVYAVDPDTEPAAR